MAASAAAPALANMVVSVPPGWMTMTGMCHGASSVRSAVDRDSSAALLAPIGLAKGAATRAVGALMFDNPAVPEKFSRRRPRCPDR